MIFVWQGGFDTWENLDAVDRLGSCCLQVVAFESAVLLQTDERCDTGKFWCPVICEIGRAGGSVCSTSDCCLAIANKLKLGGLWAEL